MGWSEGRQGKPLPLGALETKLHQAAVRVQGDVYKRQDLYREECLWLGLALALLWLILAAEWRGGADRRELWFWVASLLVVTGPMLVVSPVNARMFFSSYLFLCLAASVLFRRARAEGLRPLTRLNRAAAAAGVDVYKRQPLY